MKTRIYSVVLFLLFIGCDFEDDQFEMSEIEHKNETSQESVDSSWTYNEYKSAELSIDITNHNLKNFSVLINYKEALIFAFLGMLRMQNENNVLSEVTGALQNSVNGAIYGNFTYLADKLKISGL